MRVLLTHNPHHAYPLGTRFLRLDRGRLMGADEKGEIDRAGEDGDATQADAPA